ADRDAGHVVGRDLDVVEEEAGAELGAGGRGRTAGGDDSGDDGAAGRRAVVDDEGRDLLAGVLALERDGQRPAGGAGDGDVALVDVGEVGQSFEDRGGGEPCGGRGDGRGHLAGELQGDRAAGRGAGQ